MLSTRRFATPPKRTPLVRRVASVGAEGQNQIRRVLLDEEATVVLAEARDGE